MSEPEFNRSEYLSSGVEFEAGEVETFDEELSEFNENPEDLARELAYTRYYLAKAESIIFRLRRMCEQICKES